MGMDAGKSNAAGEEAVEWRNTSRWRQNVYCTYITGILSVTLFWRVRLYSFLLLNIYYLFFFFLLKKRYGRHRDSPSLQILFFSCCVSLPFGLAYCVALYSVEWRPCKKSVKVRLGSSSVRSKVQHWEIKVRAEIGSQFAVGSTSE